MANIIDCRTITSNLKIDIANEVKNFKDQTGISPKLTAVIVGDDPASQIYVRNKIKACEQVGILSEVINLRADERILKETIDKLNADTSVHGYILQLPLPKPLNPFVFFDMIDVKKDVDVFNPENVGLLVQGRPRFKPCTPHGIQMVLYHSGIKVAGKKIALINRSLVIGRPLSSMFIQECDDFANATVSVCHDQTPPELLKDICLSADVIVVAVGKPKFLTEDMVREGQVIIDVGINRIDGKVVGDVDFEPVSRKVEWISTVPNGIGLSTITMLLHNTLLAAKIQLGIN